MMSAPLESFKDQIAKAAFGTTEQIPGKCRRCKQAFSDKNVFTPAGWRETKITGICEKCFDEVCGDEEE